MRVARFKLDGRFDGTAGATLTVEYSRATGAGLFSVRPSRRRRAFTLNLDDVARGVIFRVVTAELREKRRARKAARR